MASGNCLQSRQIWFVLCLRGAVELLKWKQGAMARLGAQCPCCPGVMDVAGLHIHPLGADEHCIDSPE